MKILLFNNFFTTPLKKHISIIIGISLMLLYIYFVFLFERPLRNIPFTLNILGFFFLISIISSQIYLIYKWFHPSSSQLLMLFLKKYLSWILNCLVVIDDGIKTMPMIREIYANLMLYLTRNININDLTFWRYLTFSLNITPRILLCVLFFIDVFYFGQLNYIYKMIWIGICIFFCPYIIYCFKNFQEDLTVFLEINITKIHTTYVKNVLPPEEDYWNGEYIFDPDECDEEPPTQMALSIRRFLQYRWYCIINNDPHKNDPFDCIITSNYFHFYTKEHNLPQDVEPTEIQIQQLYEFLDNMIFDIIKANKIMEMIKSIIKEQYVNVKIKNTFLLLLWYYFLSWSYILIVSISSLSLTDLVHTLFEMSRMLEDPFTGIIFGIKEFQG